MISYKDAGVDIDVGNNFVEKIKPLVKSTTTPLVIGGIGSFSGAIRLPSGYKNPAILGATDGVGTKLRLAIDASKFDTVGQDLVAMCVNDRRRNKCSQRHCQWLQISKLCTDWWRNCRNAFNV